VVKKVPPKAVNLIERIIDWVKLIEMLLVEDDPRVQKLNN